MMMITNWVATDLSPALSPVKLCRSLVAITMDLLWDTMAGCPMYPIQLLVDVQFIVGHQIWQGLTYVFHPLPLVFNSLDCWHCKRDQYDCLTLKLRSINVNWRFIFTHKNGFVLLQQIPKWRVAQTGLLTYGYVKQCFEQMIDCCQQQFTKLITIHYIVFL